MGAELGHTKLVYRGRQCTCGQFGCAESYCSASALVQQAKEALAGNKNSVITEMCGCDLSRIDGRMIFSALEQGDAVAKQVVDQYVDYLSCALSTFVVIFRPEVIILGGGMANAGKTLRDPLIDRLKVNTFAGNEIGVPDIVMAARGNDAGIIGAAMLEIYGIDRRKRG